MSCVGRDDEAHERDQADASDEQSVFSGGAVRPAGRAAPRPTRAPSSTEGPSLPTASPAPAAAPAPSKEPSAPPPVDKEARLKAMQMLDLCFADLRAGKKARALTYARTAVELDPRNSKANALLADWAHADVVAKAEAEDRVLVADAQRAEESGEYENAIALYKKAIALKPDDAELHNRLGILFALRMKDFTAATNALMKASELAPQNLAYRSNLSRVFKFATGAQLTALHAGDDSDALKAAADAAKKPQGFLAKLRGK